MAAPELSLSLFGAAPSSAGRLAVRIAAQDTSRAIAGGSILSSGTFEVYEDDEADIVEAGLFDEDTFGPLPFRGDYIDFEALARPRKAQAHDFGLIILKHAVRHPWLVRHLPELADEAPIRFLPVLPAGLRSASVRDGELVLDDATRLYQHILDANARGSGLQDAVDQLFFGSGELTGFAGYLRGRGAEKLGELAAAADDAAFTRVLDGSAFTWRAMAEASCLEIVGAPDEWMEKRSRATRRRICERILGKSDSSPIAADGIEALTFRSMFLTSGMATRAMTPKAGMQVDPNAAQRVELACQFDSELGPAEIETLRQRFLEVAVYPFREETLFAPGHDVKCEEPLLPGSQLAAWCLFAVEDDWETRLMFALPWHPRVLLAVPITEAERLFKVSAGADALREKLAARGALIANPRRSPVV